MNCFEIPYLVEFLALIVAEIEVRLEALFNARLFRDVTCPTVSCNYRPIS